MFDSQAGGPDGAVTLAQVEAAHRRVLADECRLVELAAHWAELHHPDSQAPAEKALPGAEQGRQLGGDGTPEVLEFCAAEFGAQMQTGYVSATPGAVATHTHQCRAVMEGPQGRAGNSAFKPILSDAG
jgi:hypothetical protein